MAMMPPHSPTSSTTSGSTQSSGMSVMPEEDREKRVAAAVAMFEHGKSFRGKVSVRKAARMYGLPKSTVHRHIQASRGIESPPRRRSTKKRVRVSPPKKCDITFLLNNDSSSCYQEPFGYSIAHPSAQAPMHAPLQMLRPTYDRY